MSSDLLKEFGGPEVNPWRAVTSQSPANRTSVDEDDFGDFEKPETEESNKNNCRTSSPPSNAVRYHMGSEWGGTQASQVEQGYLQSSTTEVEDGSSIDEDWGDFSQQSVIFDADVEATIQRKEADGTLVGQRRPGELTNVLLHSMTGTNALTPASLNTWANGSQGSQEVTKAVVQSSKDGSERQFEVMKATKLERPTIDDTPWADFERVKAQELGRMPSNHPPSRTVKAVEVSSLGPPPSNIPPPSILLPIVTTIFGSLATHLKAVASNQPLDQPSRLSQLRTLLSSIRAAARILAGRKFHWKRDNLLSQSMKIGPAHSGKAGGMKLAGVDKAESRREDQEAAEALQVWRQQAGPLRSTIVALNGQLPENERFKISEIADNMPIRQGKPSEGMVTAPKCCFLCGIKRDERVAKVDVDVEDSFGEWWVDHWGHVDCVALWEKHKDSLRQR